MDLVGLLFFLMQPLYVRKRMADHCFSLASKIDGDAHIPSDKQCCYWLHHVSNSREIGCDTSKTLCKLISNMCKHISNMTHSSENITAEGGSSTLSVLSRSCSAHGSGAVEVIKFLVLEKIF
jgi:hypothetical protein